MILKGEHVWGLSEALPRHHEPEQIVAHQIAAADGGAALCVDAGQVPGRGGVETMT